MTTEKFASLHGGLIARKGEAAPASALLNPFNIDEAHAPAAFDRVHDAPMPDSVTTSTSAPAPVPVPVPAAPEMVRSETTAQQEVPAPAKTPASRPAAPMTRKTTSTAASKKMKAITLRIEPSKYRRIQVAAAKEGTTAQDLLRDAVDRQLAFMGEELYPECQCIRGDGFCS